MISSGKRPKISIVVPVYGTEIYFKRCMESLLGQSLKEVEIIVVNDGSPGEIRELAAGYLTDDRVRFIDSEENQGLLRARILGSREARGDYLAFVDSDDYVSYDFYRCLWERARESGADITLGHTVWKEGEECYVYTLHDTCLRVADLEGEEIRRAFFSQGFRCYSWHTIWNKLYRKELWDSCMIDFETVDRHIVMTEDIFFSSLLFFRAEKLARTENNAYFYCVNETGSTNVGAMSPERFRKNLTDIKAVFQAVEERLKPCSPEPYVIRGLSEGRRHYARMWNNLAETVFSGRDLEEARELTDALCIDRGEAGAEEDHYFESIKAPWGGGLEYIKEQIRDWGRDYVSFDVFDTLVTRPFYDAHDLLALLDDPRFSPPGSGLFFSELRLRAEEEVREYCGKRDGTEDIGLDQIYDHLVCRYGIDRELAGRMKTEELRLEKDFCRPRRAGLELYGLARASGKKVVLITDMYLDRETIEEILRKNGVTGWHRLFISCEEGCLKGSGRLFVRALDRLGLRPGDLLHIGDSWKSDIEGSRLAGMDSIFFPRSTEVFEGRILDCGTDRCAVIGAEVCGERVDYRRVSENLGFRCMQAAAAAYYFDNPYRSFDPGTDFNGDPAFIGYYLLGMHLTGLGRWICGTLRDRPTECLVFLARDGYLPMKALEIIRDRLGGEWPEFRYLQASRRALLPVMVREKAGFYQLPVEYQAHSPETLLSVLEFADRGGSRSDLYRHLRELDLEPERPFRSIREYYDFIEIFLEDRYDEEKHRAAAELVREYYRGIPDGALAFDLGYSGRVQAAVCHAAGKRVDVLFLHEDRRVSGRLKRKGGFEIRSLYHFSPAVTGLLREYFLSESAGSCIGFEKKEGVLRPVREESIQDRTEYLVIRMIQENALRFLKDFLDLFGGQSLVNDFSPEEVSLPFEGFLCRPCRKDLRFLSPCRSEDLLFGARREISLEEFAVRCLGERGWDFHEGDRGKKLGGEASGGSETCKRTGYHPDLTGEEKKGIRPETGRARISAEEGRILDIIHHSSRWKRSAAWFLMDRSFFMEKLEKYLRRYWQRRHSAR